MWERKMECIAESLRKRAKWNKSFVKRATDRSAGRTLTDVGDDPVNLARGGVHEVEPVAVGDKHARDEDVPEAEEGVGDPAGVEGVVAQPGHAEDHGELLAGVAAGRDLDHHRLAVLKGEKAIKV